jgi:hypothetical protein
VSGAFTGWACVCGEPFDPHQAVGEVTRIGSDGIYTCKACGAWLLSHQRGDSARTAGVTRQLLGYPVVVSTALEVPDNAVVFGSFGDRPTAVPSVPDFLVELHELVQRWVDRLDVQMTFTRGGHHRVEGRVQLVTATRGYTATVLVNGGAVDTFEPGAAPVVYGYCHSCGKPMSEPQGFFCTPCHTAAADAEGDRDRVDG